MRNLDENASFRVLSFDGGGIRGVIPATWYNELDKLWIAGHADQDSPFSKQFNLIAGTSTGSLLACAVAMQRDSSEGKSFYLRDGGNVFRGWSFFNFLLPFTGSPFVNYTKYPEDYLKEQLQKVFKDMTMEELKIPTVVPVYCTKSCSLVLFTSWGPHKSFPVWEVCKASCSAPAYFPPHTMSFLGSPMPFVDGGVVANNPSAIAVAIAKNSLAKAKSKAALLVTSLGTGNKVEGFTPDANWGITDWSPHIIEMLFDGSAEATERVVKLLVPESRLFRFQVSLPKGLGMLDCPQNVHELNTLAIEYMSKHDHDFRRLITELEDSRPLGKIPLTQET